MDKRKRSNMVFARDIGAWVAVLGFVAGLVASFFFSFALFVIGPLFVLGVLSFVVGQAALWLGHRRQRQESFSRDMIMHET